MSGVQPCAIDAGDTAFMMSATAFVFLQTPAAGIAQAGLIRRKNALSMMMQTVFGMAIGSLLWFSIGYSLTFSTSLGGVIGNLDRVFFKGLSSLDTCSSVAPKIPEALFAGFQMMFALMTPIICSGAWAEKMSVPGFIMFVSVWPFLVYYPLAHWLWNSDGFLNTWGCQDFAGGCVIHLSSGVAGFVVSIVLQRRKATKHLNDQGHNLPLAVLGTSLIWGGWYSFNGGSAYSASNQAAVALLNTHISACASGVTWTLLMYSRDKKWHLLEMLSGSLAGLAAITAGSGFVEPYGALIIGTVAGFVSRLSVDLFKDRMGLDDVLDVTSLQGAPGAVGTLLVGFFASTKIGGTANGIVEGGGGDGLVFLGKQACAVAITIVLSGIMTYLLMFVMKRTIGIDVSSHIEEIGLDLGQIGEQAYDTRLDEDLDLGRDTLTSKLFDATAHGDVQQVTSLITLGADPLASDYDGRTLTHIAAALGHITVLRILVERYHTPVNERDRWDGTPLQDAVRSGHSECAQFLREKGGTVDIEDFGRDIMAAAASGNVKRIKELVHSGGVEVNYTDYDFRTPLMVASAEGALHCVRLLLQLGADPNMLDRWGHSALHDAMRFNHDAVAMVLKNTVNTTATATTDSARRRVAGGSRRDGGVMRGVVDTDSDLGEPLISSINSDYENDEYPTAESGAIELPEMPSVVITTASRELCAAASVGDLAEVRRLIIKNKDANVSDYDDRTPLHLAVTGNHTRVVEYLLTVKGINVNALDRWNRSAMHDALDHRYSHLVEILRNAGCTAQDRFAGFSLCKAAFERDISRLASLKEGGVDVNTSDYDSRTALHLAACRGDIETIKWLLAHGAIPTVTDRYNNRPVDDARRAGEHEAAHLLDTAIAEYESHLVTRGSGDHQRGTKKSK